MYRSDTCNNDSKKETKKAVVLVIYDDDMIYESIDVRSSNALIPT